MQIPSFGLGTFRLKQQAAYDSVSTALELGYRAIDTAQIYENEEEVGKAMAASGIARKDVFITTKVWVSNFGKDRFAASLRESLDKLQTDYADLVLIHWPALKGPVALPDYMQSLAKAKSDGLTRQIGISNFTIALTRQAIDEIGNGELATNQIELSPYLQNRTLAGFLKEQGIRVTSYMTLAYGKVLKDPLIIDIARKHGATPAQVALAWALQQDYAVIPSSTRRENLASNLLAQELRLDEDDMARIAGLDRGSREANPAELAPDWD